MLILDGYVDEPANFGVPPYISPHARYLAGAALDATDGQAELRYRTADQWRNDPRDVAECILWGDFLVVISGALVPGVYLRGRPLSFREAQQTVEAFRGPALLAGSAAMYGFGQGGGKPAVGRDRLARMFKFLGKRHPDKLLHDVLAGEDPDPLKRRTMDEWHRWSVLGSGVTQLHPDHPNPLIAELDTYYGCVRYVNSGCSFCIEPKEGKPEYRPIQHVVDEVRALAEAGVVNFRLGGQACFYSYQARGLGETPTPKPDPQAIEQLLRGIHDACPGLRTLHLDNADPAVMAAHEREAREVTRLIARYMTPGNIAALGMETADPRVVEENNLNAMPEEVWLAMEILNEEGGHRGWNGVPCILPGLNFLAGLWGEREETWQLNRAFLERLSASDLLVRRINIRQILSTTQDFGTDGHKFHRFKQWCRQEVDVPMLHKVFPEGTILRDVYLEKHDGNVTFGRQLGTYPILVGLPYKTGLDRFVDVRITDHGKRSVTGIEAPLSLNRASLKALSSLPGVGDKRAMRLHRARPYTEHQAVLDALDDQDVARNLMPMVRLGEPE